MSADCHASSPRLLVASRADPRAKSIWQVASLPWKAARWRSVFPLFVVVSMSTPRSRIHDRQSVRLCFAALLALLAYSHWFSKSRLSAVIWPNPMRSSISWEASGWMLPAPTSCSATASIILRAGTSSSPFNRSSMSRWVRRSIALCFPCGVGAVARPTFPDRMTSIGRSYSTVSALRRLVRSRPLQDDSSDAFDSCRASMSGVVSGPRSWLIASTATRSSAVISLGSTPSGSGRASTASLLSTSGTVGSPSSGRAASVWTCDGTQISVPPSSGASTGTSPVFGSAPLKPTFFAWIS